jgi:SAM-dependent methyltransferase
MTQSKRRAGIVDKTHWYDGEVYRRFVDPMSGGGLARLVADFIDPGAAVLDVACGTGALACKLAAHCREVVGIDLSSRMIAFARRQAAAAGLDNIEFVHGSARGLAQRWPRRFDFVVMTQFLHSVPEDLRRGLAADLPALAQRFILADFIAPLPRGLSGMGIHLLELLEGRTSYGAFRHWIAHGGLDGYLARSGLRIEREKLYHSRLGKVVLTTC